jgi:integrase
MILATIIKRKQGFRVQIRRKCYVPISKSLASKQDAQERALDEERERILPHVKRLPLDPRKVTLREVLVRYLTDVTRAKISRETEHYRIAKIVRAPIADLSLLDLTPSVVAQLRDDRLIVVKATTVCRELHLIKQNLNIAKREWGYDLAENPVEMVKYPKIRNTRNRRMTDRGIDDLIEALGAIERSGIIAVIRFALEAAMRRGEILTLEWPHVDLQRRTEHLPRTKNGYARTVPMTNGTMEVLLKQPRTFDSKLVFNVSSDALKMCWRKIVVKTELYDLHFHDFRHEAISRLFEMELIMPEVALISGNRDPRKLMRYIHLVLYQLAKKLRCNIK